MKNCLFADYFEIVTVCEAKRGEYADGDLALFSRRMLVNGHT